MISTSVQSSQRIEALPWPAILDQLNTQGFAAIGQVLAPEECNQFVSMYANDRYFRRRVIMQRYGYGRGEYQYFAGVAQHKDDSSGNRHFPVLQIVGQ